MTQGLCRVVALQVDWPKCVDSPLTVTHIPTLLQQKLGLKQYQYSLYHRAASAQPGCYNKVTINSACPSDILKKIRLNINKKKKKLPGPSLGHGSDFISHGISAQQENTLSRLADGPLYFFFPYWSTDAITITAAVSLYCTGAWQQPILHHVCPHVCLSPLGT